MPTPQPTPAAPAASTMSHPITANVSGAPSAARPIAADFHIRRHASGLCLHHHDRSPRPFLLAPAAASDFVGTIDDTSPDDSPEVLLARPSHVLVGDRTEWLLYQHAPLVQFLLDHQFLLDTPLPPPLPLPASITELSSRALDLFVLLGLGTPMNEILGLMPDAAAYNSELRAAGILPLSPPRAASRLTRELEAIAPPAPPAPLTPPQGDTDDPGDDATEPVVRSLPPAAVEALRARASARARGSSTRWPFRDMKVGDAVVFPPVQARAAQRAAHAYAAVARPKMKFHTWTDPRTGAMNIFRAE